MSELPPIVDGFRPRVPPKEATELVNGIVRGALARAVSSVKPDKVTGRRDPKAVAYAFHEELGSGVIEAKIETLAREFPDEYVACTPKEETAFRNITRAHDRSFSHPAVLSCILKVAGNGSPNICHIGTDKLGHLVQQGYDYWLIYNKIGHGLAKLYAQAWGLWTEGKKISEMEINAYIEDNHLKDLNLDAAKIRKNILKFLENDELIKTLNPTPSAVKKVEILRWTAHAIGNQELGILGTASTGIFSYADLEANRSGLEFYLELERDPETLAKSFDVKNYIKDCSWDESVLRPEYSKENLKEIEQVVNGKSRHHNVYGANLGLKLGHGVPILEASPLLGYYELGDQEFRVSAGAMLPMSLEAKDYSQKSGVFMEFDLAQRISGLHFLTLSMMVGTNFDLASPDLAKTITNNVELSYEVMLLGKTSFKFGAGWDIWKKVPYAKFGTLILWI